MVVTWPHIRGSTAYVTFLAAFLPEEQAPRLIQQQLGGGGGGAAVEFKAIEQTKPNTRPSTLTKIKSKTKTLFIQIQVCPLVCPTALRVLEGVGGILGQARYFFPPQLVWISETGSQRGEQSSRP